MSPKPFILQQIEPYIHHQVEPSMETIVQHDKGNLCPQVVLVLENGSQFESEIKYLDDNFLKVLTNTPISFYVYVY
jgi:hypothetical protein